jgi:hypothetical protein
MWTLMTKGDAPEAGPSRHPAAPARALPSRDPAIPGVPPVAPARSGSADGPARRSGLGAIAAIGIALAAVAGVVLVATVTLFVAPIIKVGAAEAGAGWGFPEGRGAVMPCHATRQRALH